MDGLAGVPALLAIAGLVTWLALRSARNPPPAGAAVDARHLPIAFDELVRRSPDITMVVEAGGAIRFASGVAVRRLGRESLALTGQPLAGLVHPDDRVVLSRMLDRPGAEGERRRSGEVRISHVDGSWIHFEAVPTFLPPAGGEPGGVMLNLRDLTERRRQEQALRELALHDPLTRLANRALFRDHVGHALATLRRTPVQHAVLFMDLDDFKTINDSLGHAAGDEVLVTVAERLRSRVRPNDVVARLGGDEFAILVENTCERDAVDLARRVLDALELPVVVQGKRVWLGGSTGIALSNAAGDADQILRNADVAMYRAKAEGKGRFAVFEPEMHLAALNRLDLEADLRRAVEAEDLYLEYQPVIHLATGHIAKVEALVRWRRPGRGSLPPGQFIPLAEQSGLINALGLQVLRTACRQARLWHDRFPDRRPVGVAVNVSVRQVESDRFVEQVETCLRESGVDPVALTLEITESVFMSEFQTTLDRLRRLKALGIKLAIDDFGTGYSSLSYLRLLPVDVLKIDKSFVDGVAGGPEQSAVARAAVSLARTFELESVAEGIETAEQLRELVAIGADMGQGFHFAPPLGAAEITALLVQESLPVAALRPVSHG